MHVAMVGTSSPLNASNPCAHIPTSNKSMRKLGGISRSAAVCSAPTRRELRVEGSGGVNWQRNPGIEARNGSESAGNLAVSKLF